MASMMTSTMAILPYTPTTSRRLSLAPTKGRVPTKKNQCSEARASLSAKEHAAAAVAMTAMLVIPEIAEAAQPGMSPSLNNFLLSIASGGLVLTAIIGAVVGVSNFDPVKRA